MFAVCSLVFCLLQQRRQGLMFGGGCLILLSAFGRHVCDQLFQKCVKSGIHYMSLKFFSLHFLPSFFFHIPLSSFYFPFQCLLPPHIHLFPPSFKCSSPILSPASYPPLPSPTLHAPSDWFLCPSNFSSNAARAAFHPPASGAASLCALLMRLRAGKPRKCQV